MAVTRTGSVIQIQNSSQSGSQSVTVPSDAQACVVIVTFYGNFNWIANNPVTLAGSNLTTVQKTDEQIDNGHVWIGYKVSPATGSQTLAWNWGATPQEGANICVVFYTGVDTSNPIVSSGQQLSANTDLTGLTASAGDMMVGGVYSYDSSPTVTDNSQTQLAVMGRYNLCYGGFAEKDGGTGFYFSSGNYNTVVALVLKAAAGGGATYNESVTLTKSLAISQGNNLVADTGLTMNRTMGMSDGSQADFQAGVTINRNDAISLVGSVDMAGLLTLAKALGISLAGGLDISAVLTLARSMGVTFDNVVTKEETLTLAKALVLASTTQLDAASSMILAKMLAISEVAQADLVSSLTLARSASISFDGALAGLTYEVSLALAKTLAISLPDPGIQRGNVPRWRGEVIRADRLRQYRRWR